MTYVLRFSPVLTAAVALPVAPPPPPPPPPLAPKPVDGPAPAAAADSWPPVEITLSDLQWGPDDPFEMPEPQKIAPPNRAARRKQAKNRG